MIFNLFLVIELGQYSSHANDKKDFSLINVIYKQNKKKIWAYFISGLGHSLTKEDYLAKYMYCNARVYVYTSPEHTQAT